MYIVEYETLCSCCSLLNTNHKCTLKVWYFVLSCGRWVLIVSILWLLVPKTNVEDEYAKAAERDPKILIITPQDPSDLLVKVAEVTISSLSIPSYCFCVHFVGCNLEHYYALFVLITDMLIHITLVLGAEIRFS